MAPSMIDRASEANAGDMFAANMTCSADVGMVKADLTEITDSPIDK
jgi:hypothetical protein